MNILNITKRRTVRPMIKIPRHVTIYAATLDTRMLKRKLSDVMKSGFLQLLDTPHDMMLDIKHDGCKRIIVYAFPSKLQRSEAVYTIWVRYSFVMPL